MVVFFFITATLFLLLLWIGVKAGHLNDYFEAAYKADDQIKETDKINLLREESLETRQYINVAKIGGLILLLIGFYFVIKGTAYEGHFYEWMNLVVRLIHITFGIAWIGASFYFVFLENSLNRTKNLRNELAGNLWAVHGGGFYYLEKYKLAPKTIPKELHWFKYEAYFTFLSGFALLCIVYYFNAKGFLIDSTVLDISPIQGIAIGIGSLISSWVIYDLLCKSPLSKNQLIFAIISLLILIGYAYFLSNVFNSRAAYIHFGAILGTIMAGNVYFVIIPAQKEMVRAAKMGLPLDPRLGKNAGLRSLHNNYTTLPVLFVMISNHFPSTFGHEYQWVVLIAITLGTAGIKHYLNVVERGEKSVWVLPISVFILLAVALVTAPEVSDGKCEEVPFPVVYSIINERCVTCHSSRPTDDVWVTAPNGIKYDTPEDIAKLTDKIMQRVVVTKTMPQNNKTGMLPEERELLRCWIEQGAKLK